MFVIGLHVDDFNVLRFIQNNLNIGRVARNGDECKFVVTDKNGIDKLISIFDKFTLNTSKYLDYLDFKEAFRLYFAREGVLTDSLKDKILVLKEGMNLSRVHSEMPNNHKIVITKYWLLGLIEGEGSFQLWRNDIQPAFGLVLSIRQLALLEKIKEFLFSNLGFDIYSLFKLNSSSSITLNNLTQKARNNLRGMTPASAKNSLWNLCGAYTHDLSSLFINKRLGSYAAYSTQNSTQDSTQNFTQLTLNPNFITGFTDGEGSFIISVIKRNSGRYIEAIFQITLHQKDTELLLQIQQFFGGVGSVRKSGKESYTLTVSSRKQLLDTIIPHFDKYPLLSQKLCDYFIWKDIVLMTERKEHLTLVGMQKIINLKASLNWGLSDELKKAFPETIAIPRPKIDIDAQAVKNSNWVAGFTSGEGCFFLKISKNAGYTTGYQVQLRFLLTQHVRDELLLRNFITFWGCGSSKLRSDKFAVDYIVTKLTDINNIIIPFFDKFPILGVKTQDFELFKKAAKIMSNGDHLTQKGLDKLNIIKSNMNKKKFMVLPMIKVKI